MVYFGGFGVQPSRRLSRSASTSRVRLATSRVIGSPSRTNAIGPAVDRLRRDVADAQAGGAAGEPAVGDQQDVLAEAGALDRAGDREHLAHPRDRPWGPRSGSPRRRRRRSVPASSASIAARSPSKTRAVPSNVESSKPADFTTAPSGASEPLQDGDARRSRGSACRSARMILPSTSGGAMSARFSAIVRPVTVRHVAVHQAGVEQRLHHHRDAADLVDVVHHVAAERLEVAEVRHLVADPVEVVERQRRPRPRARSPAGAGRRWWSRRAPSPRRSRSRTPRGS